MDMAIKQHLNLLMPTHEMLSIGSAPHAIVHIVLASVKPTEQTWLDPNTSQIVSQGALAFYHGQLQRGEDKMSSIDH